jgi:hypothetical protein
MVETQYAYGRIAKLDEQLRNAGIPASTVEEIMAGGTRITQSTKPAAKADWMREAMLRLEQHLGRETAHAIREGCACTLGGRRLEICKRIARTNHDIGDRIRASNESRYVFGHSVELQQDGSVLVSFQPDDQQAYRCVCLPQAKEPLPITYCYCCGGHVKHHLQAALGRPMTVKVRSSALSSGGKAPCTFLLSFAEDTTPEQQ